MPSPRQRIIRSVGEFAELIGRLANASRQRHAASSFVGNWYRGVGRSKKFKLLPSLYRHPEKGKKISELVLLEKEMQDDFQRQSALFDFGKSNGDGNRLFELLFYMQHNGVPTRLLDWSANPFIALFFALIDPAFKSTQKEDLAVWALDPTAWNKRALDEIAWQDRGPANPSDPDIESYWPRGVYKEEDIKSLKKLLRPFPIAVFGVANSARMFAQKGVFTCFGSETSPMETLYRTHGFPNGSLFKIVIPRQRAEPMLETLTAMGFTETVSYPDLHGIALEIKRLKGFRR